MTTWQAMHGEAEGRSGVTDAVLEAIARRVAELVVDVVREPFRLLDSHAVARMLSVSEEWVRDHAAELGAIRVGDGRKGVLRFEVAHVRTALEHRRLDRPSEKPRRRARSRRRSLGVVPAAVPSDVKDW
jgi:hypothetical protein